MVIKALESIFQGFNQIGSGILIGSTGMIGEIVAFPLSNSFLETLKILSNLTMPVICIIIGYELHLDMKNLWKPFLTAFSRLLILIGIAFLMNELVIERILHLDVTFKIALYTLFLLPPPFVIPIFMADKAEKNKQFIINMLSIHILLSLVAFFVLILVM